MIAVIVQIVKIRKLLDMLLNIDIIRPSCGGFVYCLTCINRYTRWTELILMTDMWKLWRLRYMLVGFLDLAFLEKLPPIKA